MSSDEKTALDPEVTAILKKEKRQVSGHTSTPVEPTGKWQYRSPRGPGDWRIYRPDGTFFRKVSSNIAAYEMVKDKNAVMEATERAEFAAKEFQRVYSCLKGIVGYWDEIIASGDIGKIDDDPHTAEARKLIAFYENPLP